MRKEIRSADVKEVIALTFLIMKDGRQVVVTQGKGNVKEWHEAFEALSKKYLKDNNCMNAMHVNVEGDESNEKDSDS